MDKTPVKIVAHLASPLAGNAPQLDGILEYHQVRKQIGTHIGDIEIVGALSRAAPPPPTGYIPIPLCRSAWKINGSHMVDASDNPIWIAHCSEPIIIGAEHDGVERMARRIDNKNYHLLAENERKTINHAAGPQKDYFIPIRVRTVKAVAWFALAFGEKKGGVNNGDQRRSPEASLYRLLKRIRAIGKLHQHGYGMVGRWEIIRVEKDYSWYADSAFGAVLMRVLPHEIDGMPQPLLGARPGYAAACPPYWHPHRQMKVMIPC